jgi:hypothetical protein
MNGVDVTGDQAPKSRFRAGFHVIGKQSLTLIHLHLLFKGRPTLIPNKFIRVWLQAKCARKPSLFKIWKRDAMFSQADLELETA